MPYNGSDRAQICWSVCDPSKPPTTPLACGAGRDDLDMEYDVGFDGEGRILALAMRVRLLGGWAKDLASDDGAILKEAAGMVRGAWQGVELQGIEGSGARSGL